MISKYFESLKGKNILITGSSSDIGIILIKELLQFDMKIGAHYFTNASILEQFKEDIIPLQGNLSSREQCNDVVDSFIDQAGSIDFFVHLAGNIKKPVHWEQVSSEDWYSDIDTNLSSAFFLSQKVSASLKSKGGKMIFISTASASHGGGSMTLPYGIAKAGIECMTKGLGRDLAVHNVLVNCISPGFIDTKFHVKAGKSEDDIKRRVELIPLKRAGTPEDVVGAIMYLLSDSGNYITGEILTISGGDWL
ncbi:SDR family oxidoreductase [Methanolobus sp. WCC1]|jgi:3-oxoacyl-[acyl-carrier protein] reductase|uniref:SDR family NAD(P)-dependent oxidoreductase n=1 Tax=unclassified Methanolobus TaxID=2629569 RepID=UPI0032476D1A